MADIERAKVLIELRRLSEAREQLAAVLAAEPDNAEAATYLAQAAYLDQRYSEAAEQSAAALRIQPRNQFAMRIHALALLNTDAAGRWQAQRVAHQVVALGPEFAENHRILAIVLRECGNLPDALAAIDRAVELDPDEADIHVARGSILRRMGRCGNGFRSGPAAEAYHTALRLEPENAYAVHDLAIVELNGRRLRNALRGVLDAASMDPGLGDLVRTNTATVVRHALRRMHWVLTAIAFVALVLGSHQISGNATTSAPIPAAAVAGSQNFHAPQQITASGAPATVPAVAPAPGSGPAAGTHGPVATIAQTPGVPVRAPGSSAVRAPVAAPPQGAADIATHGVVAAAPRAGGDVATQGAVAAAPQGPGGVARQANGSSSAQSPGSSTALTTTNAHAEAGAPAPVTFPPMSGAANPPTPPATHAGPPASRTHDIAHLGRLGRGFGAIGLGAIGLVSLWWLAVVPRRRRRFVLTSAWSSPPTALRMVVFGVGLIVCVVGVASGLRVFLSVGEPVLLALGIILRRIA